MGVYFVLRDLLKEKGLKEKPFAASIQVQHRTMYGICNNTIERVPVHVIEKICKALDVVPGDWIKYKKDEEGTD